jgi:hypothetical protein
MARKPPALARELLRNFPKRRARNARRRRKGGGKGAGNGAAPIPAVRAELVGQQIAHTEDELRQDVRDGLARDATLDHAGEQA